ncbi:MAG TPA: TetR/AcrR family transcriptional regulator [Solirubrobacterales bacterium]|nr:TetR/AcrR family transcriptional regulator [Solirubrobacterales bacterium]
MLRTAGESGYHQTTVDDVLERSGEPSGRFYQHFRSKDECFLTAYERVAGELAERMLAAGRSGATWCHGLTRALGELLDFVTADPALAAALLVEVRAVKGATAVHDEILSRFVPAIESAREEPGARSSIPYVAPLMMGAVEGYLRQMLVRAETETAHDALAGFVYLFVLNYFGEEAAFEAMDRVKDR